MKIASRIPFLLLGTHKLLITQLATLTDDYKLLITWQLPFRHLRHLKEKKTDVNFLRLLTFF
jgi:hypothetical protein